MADPPADPNRPNDSYKVPTRHTSERHWELMQAAFQAIQTSYDLLQRSARLRQEIYRLYLLRRESGIQAAEFFAAPDDQGAEEIASSVHEACSDVFDKYELWRGQTRITSGKRKDHDSTGLYFEQLHQDTIVDLEERLQRAFACMNRSRRLAEVSARLRKY